MSWNTQVQIELFAAQPYRYYEFKDDVYKEFVQMQEIDDDSFLDALGHCRPYFYSGYDKAEIKDFLRTIISKYNNKLTFLKRIEAFGTMTEFNILVYTLLFRSCFWLQLMHFYDSEDLVKRIALGMRHKEFVLATMDFYGAVHHLIDLKRLCNVLWYLLDQNTDNDVLLYNYNIYFIANTKRLFGKEGLQVIYDANEVTRDFTKSILLHLVINGYLNDSIAREYMKEEDPEIKSLVFKAICKVTKRLKHFTPDEVAFVMEYVGTGELNIIKQFFTYFVSHYVVLTNDAIVNRGQINCEFLKTIHNLCIHLLYSGDEDKILVGAYVYVEMYNTVRLGRLKTAYTLKPRDIYGPRENPLFLLNVRNETWEFGESTDINKFLKTIDFENFNGFFYILKSLEFTEYVIDVEEFYKMFDNLLCKPILHMDEKMATFIIFFIKHYRKEASAFFEKLVDITLLQPTVDCVEHSMYSNFRAISIYITRRSDDIPNQMKQDMLPYAKRTLDMLLLTYFRGSSKSHMELKFAEKMIAYCIDIILELYRSMPKLTDDDMKQVEIVMDKGLQCNMRFAVTHIAETFRLFVQSKSEQHSDFFYDYLFIKVRSISSHEGTNSMLRRSTEYRLIIHAICCGINKTKKKMFLERIVRYMTSLYMSLISNNNFDCCTIILHCLQQIIEESSLKEYTMYYIEYILLLCLYNIGHSNYKLNNATCLLFEAAITRILPSAHSQNNMCLHDFLMRFGHLRGLRCYLPWDPQDTKDSLKSKILYIQLIQRADNNNVYLNPKEKEGILFVPLILRSLSDEQSIVTPFFMRFLVHITPYNNYPYLYNSILLAVVDQMRKSLELTYIFLETIQLLLDKYEYFLMQNNVKYSQYYFNKMTEQINTLPLERNIIKLKAIGLLELSNKPGNGIWHHNNQDFTVENLKLFNIPHFVSLILRRDAERNSENQA